MSLQENGYEIIRGFYDYDRNLAPIFQEIDRLGLSMDPGFAHDRPSTLDPDQQSRLYGALRYLPSLVRLAANESNLDLASRLGLEAPAVMHCFNVRLDAPAKEAFNFHWHQDLTYLLGSLNSLTYWIPLTRVDADHGTIEIVPGSHRSGLFPMRYTGNGSPTRTQVMSPKDVVLENEPGPDDETIFVEANPGDLVVFSQLLLHRSSPNHSDQTRWTVQLRYADLMEQEFVDEGYPFGDRTNIFHTGYPALLEQRAAPNVQN